MNMMIYKNTQKWREKKQIINNINDFNINDYNI